MLSLKALGEETYIHCFCYQGKSLCYGLFYFKYKGNNILHEKSILLTFRNKMC